MHTMGVACCNRVSAARRFSLTINYYNILLLNGREKRKEEFHIKHMMNLNLNSIGFFYTHIQYNKRIYR